MRTVKIVSIAMLFLFGWDFLSYFVCDKLNYSNESVLFLPYILVFFGIGLWTSVIKNTVYALLNTFITAFFHGTFWYLFPNLIPECEPIDTDFSKEELILVYITYVLFAVFICMFGSMFGFAWKRYKFGRPENDHDDILDSNLD